MQPQLELRRLSVLAFTRQQLVPVRRTPCGNRAKYGGCSEEDAIKLITINPAKLLHIDDRVGSLKINKDADIVLWSNKPLSVYAKVEQTYVDGKLLFDIEQNNEQEKQLLKFRAEIISEMIMAKNIGKSTTPLKTQKNIVHKCNQTIEIDN